MSEKNEPSVLVCRTDVDSTATSPTWSPISTLRASSTDTINVVAEAAEAAHDEKSLASPPAVPDGGLQAWLQVLGSWVILVETSGLVSTFGVCETYYKTVMLPNDASSAISWIGSVQGSLPFFVGVLAGPLFDAGYFRELLASGLFLVVFGQFMTSLCQSYWEVMLAQGVCIGVGMGLIFVPSMAIIPQYFERRRALAIGIAASGPPTAGIVFPVMFSHLQAAIGFGWATRAIGFILLGLAVIPLAVMRTRKAASGKAKLALFDAGTWTDVPFLLFIFGNSLVFLVLYVPYFYIQLFSIRHQIWPESESEYLVTILNAGSLFGRILAGALAVYVGSMNIMLTSTVLSAIIALCWLGMTSLGSIIAFALLYGAFSGAAVAMVPAGVVCLSPDMSKVGARMGTTFLFAGVSLLVGPPVAGYILRNGGDAEWLGMIGCIAGCLVLAVLLFGLSRLMTAKKH
ncbi:hypothetical protein NLU13_7356 [Sarocladium strictum]|uniref:Major facilitator superfamily (MFS) profile domain-containing protein n=1 Tax=Sarocladium strictum TaxID=5046 RepID=A0AA39GCN0_SARSR|nr:hypothetical protein NLU13_7356 [Sarocladium strictum]